MELSTKKNTLDKIPVYGMNLLKPDKEKVTDVLNEALKQNYTKANVEWVTSYPDLSQPPFNLAAPGICGNTVLLDFGHKSYFKLPFTETNVYDFKQTLKIIDRERDKSDSFIFGHGVFQKISKCRLSEIVLNAFIPSTTNKKIESRNSSVLTEIDTYTGKCRKEKLSLSQLKCSVQGTYFLSKGLKTERENDASVLKVYAKGPYSDKTPFCGSKRFINTMQIALQKTFNPEHFVALGGVYAVNNVIWRHRLIQNDWEPSYTIPGCHCYVDSHKPEIMITTFTSGTKVPSRNPGFPSINLNSSQSFHSLSHHSALENHPIIYDRNKEEEYVGYFCPANSVYRIDESPSECINT